MIGVDEAMSSQQTYISTNYTPGASPEVWSELEHVTSIPGPNETSDDIDVTHLRSPGEYREFIPSFKDGGELALALNFLPAATNQVSLRTEFQASPRLKYTRRIFYPDGSYDTFDAYVKGVGRAAQVGDKLVQNFTLRITGPVTLTPFGVSP